MSNTRRVTKEYSEIVKFINLEPSDNHRFIDIIMIDNDITKIEVTFMGPKETPYEEIISTIKINIPSEYPHKPPIMHFVNKIYHPNISTNGTICLDILKNKWCPIYTLRTILMSIISLLSDPNPDSPLNGDAAREYKNSLKDKIGRRNYAHKIKCYAT